MALNDPNFEQEIRKAWNRGLARSEIAAVMVTKGFDRQRTLDRFDVILETIGCRSLTGPELYSSVEITEPPQKPRYVPRSERPKTQSEIDYDNWKGNTGPGAKLREICAADRNK